MTPVEKAKVFANKRIVQLGQAIPNKLKRKEESAVKHIGRKSGDTERLKALYKLMDELGEAATPFTVCCRGCTHCCHYNVSISEAEADYIERTTATPKLSPSPSQDFHGKPCTFLSDGGDCSIYESRPFVCRRHVNMADSPEWCAVEICNKLDLPMLRFSEVDAAYDLIMRESDKGEHKDIRQWFR